MALLGLREISMNPKTIAPLVMIGWGTYNVWAFTHGRSVSLGEAGTDEAVIAKTNSRVLTVSIHAFLILFGWVLFMW
jgi:hypothetical protein